MLYDLRERFLGWMIKKAVPALNLFRAGLPWSTSFESLAALPPEV